MLTSQIQCCISTSYRKSRVCSSLSSTSVPNLCIFFLIHLKKKYRRWSCELTDWQEKGTSEKLLQASNYSFSFLHCTVKARMKIYILVSHFSTTTVSKYCFNSRYCLNFSCICPTHRTGLAHCQTFSNSLVSREKCSVLNQVIFRPLRQHWEGKDFWIFLSVAQSGG